MKMIITEYTLVEQDGANEKFYSLKLGDYLYYKGYDSEEGIKATHEIEFASRIANQQFALELIGFLQNFFDGEGKVRLGNRDKQLPPLVGYAEAAEMLGWDKRRVGIYIQRGSFPEPMQRLASGPVWTLEQIEEYKRSRDAD